MKKLFYSFILVLCLCSCGICGEINSDMETHKIIGGLYSLSAAIDMNGSINPELNDLQKFFINVPDDWKENVKISLGKNSIWTGIAIGKYSNSRHFLRANAQELGITEAPDGYEWTGGEYVWLKAADIVNGKLKPVTLYASRGAGEDSKLLFFASNNKSFWWRADPEFNAQAFRDILNKWGVNNATELHIPSEKNQRTSIYESVKPSAVGRPQKMHVGTARSSFDMEIDMGDVIFKPIPNTRMR